MNATRRLTGFADGRNPFPGGQGSGLSAFAQAPAAGSGHRAAKGPKYTQAGIQRRASLCGREDSRAVAQVPG